MFKSKSSKYINSLHLDRLIITLLVSVTSYFPTSGYTLQNNYIQSFDEITLMYNKHRQHNGYLLTYDVLYNGEKVGIIRSSEKYHKPYAELELSKHLFYTKNKYYWYEVVSSIQEELNLRFNNIRYVEITLDSTKDFVTQLRNILFQSSWTQQNIKPKYEKVSSKTMIGTIENKSYNAGTSGNLISIYNKSSKSTLS